MNPTSGAVSPQQSAQTKNANRDRHHMVWDKPGQKFVGIFRTKFEVITRNGPQLIYKFEDGTTIWGSYVLNQKLAEVQPGMIVFIQYTGNVVTNSSRLCNTFDVLLIDPETEEVVKS